MWMLCSVSGTSVGTIRVPKTNVVSIVPAGSDSFTRLRVVSDGTLVMNIVGRTVKHPVMLPVREKAASVLCAISSRPLTLIMLSSPVGLSLRLITPLVLPVVRALVPTVRLTLVRVSVGVLPALLLITVISSLVVRLV